MKERTQKTSILRVLDLGLRDYEPVLALQARLMEQRRAGENPDVLVLVEHNPVYTMGKSAKDENILASPETLQNLRVKVIKTGRGGDVTYHGPGQLVAYPILDLSGRGMGVLAYVESLEKVVLTTLSEFGIQATTDFRSRGVWVGNDKIAALGVRVSRQITMHGFALNVATDLSYYRHIVPCGIRGKGVTSMDRLVKAVRMDDVKQKVLSSFCAVFGYGAVEKGSQ